MRFLLVASLSVVLTLVAGCYRSHDAGRDSGPRADGGPRPDGGVPIDSGGRVPCDEESLPPFSGPPCSEAVSACRSMCADGDEPCRDACLDTPCRACVYGTIFHCANEAGCEPLWRSFACCAEGVPMCGDLQGFARVTCATSCPTLFEPYAHCIESTGGMDCFLRAARDCHLR